MSKGKQWWMEPGGIRVFSGAAYCTPREGDTEVRVVPLDAVVLEEGSKKWAVCMAIDGKQLWHDGLGNCNKTVGNPPWFIAGASFDTGWYILPAPWVPKHGERVRWTRGEDTGTGTYFGAFGVKDAPYHHEVVIGGSYMGVESVSKLEEP